MTASTFATLDSRKSAGLFSRAASAFAGSFEKRTRTDGTSYWALVSDRPDWMRDAVHDAHDDELPNDLRYELIRDAAVAIADQLFDSVRQAYDAAPELAADLVPTATSELLQWFADHVSRLGQCDQALEDGHTVTDTLSLLSAGYRLEAEQVLERLICAIEDNADTVFNPDLDCQLLISDSNGVYIPKLFCDGMDEIDAFNLKICWDDVKDCQSGPDSETYWDSWQSILDSAVIVDDSGIEWRLEQNGDLWAIRTDVNLPEDWYQ